MTMRNTAKPGRLGALPASRRVRLAAGWAAACWAVGIALLSHLPDPPSPGPDFPLKDKVAHVILYAVLGGLVAVAAADPARRRRTIVAIAVVAAAAYGVVDEVHQSFIEGRAFEAVDMVADAVGGWIGATALASMLAEPGKGGVRRGLPESP